MQCRSKPTNNEGSNQTSKKTGQHRNPTTHPEFHKKECRLGTFVEQLAQASGLVGEFVRNLSNINRLQHPFKSAPTTNGGLIT